MVAWVRHSPGSEAADKVVKLDIDLCEERGNICAQMRGVNWRQGSVLEAAASPALTQVSLAVPVRKEIVLVPYPQAAARQVVRKKPTGISLAAPRTAVSAAAASSKNK